MLFRIILIIISLLAIILLIAVNLSPKIISIVVRKMFEKSPARPPENYSELLKKVNIVKDVSYASKFKSNNLDVFMPKNNSKKIKTIIWMHGGAFVGGDKKDCEIFSTVIASNNYNVINVNYERAPEQKYPAPLFQFIEVYEWIVKNNKKYNIDLNKLVLAGDSAGAHIAMQIALMVFNNDYRKKIGMDMPIKDNQICNVLLYCGPYDVTKLSKSKKKFYGYIIKQTGWAYFGMKNWYKRFKELDIVESINEKTVLPPIFITDGNTDSFEEHGKNLVEKLLKYKISTEYYFSDIKECITKHEYQFLLDTKPGQIVLEKTLDFLRKYV